MLTDLDKAVFAHLVEDPDAWIARVLADPRFGLETVLAKCRRDIHVAAYLAAKDKPDYKPRGPLPSAQACAAVAAAHEAIEQAKRDVEAAKAAQQERINNLFS